MIHGLAILVPVPHLKLEDFGGRPRLTHLVEEILDICTILLHIKQGRCRPGLPHFCPDGGEAETEEDGRGDRGGLTNSCRFPASQRYSHILDGRGRRARALRRLSAGRRPPGRRVSPLEKGIGWGTRGEFTGHGDHGSAGPEDVHPRRVPVTEACAQADVGQLSSSHVLFLNQGHLPFLEVAHTLAATLLKMIRLESMPRSAQ